VKSSREKSNLIANFRYVDLTLREQTDVKRAMEKYNNQGGTKPAGLLAKYVDPAIFYHQVIKKYGWGLIDV